jgi:hypothetical protein
MAGGPIRAHPGAIYKFTGTALGASMWFFVRIQLAPYV